LASAARTSDLQCRILQNTILHIHEQVIEYTRQQWERQAGLSAPDDNEEHSQKAWDSKCKAVIKNNLMLHALDNRDKARLIIIIIISSLKMKCRMKMSEEI